MPSASAPSSEGAAPRVILDRMKHTILAGLALLWPIASWAADDVKPLNAKPGLWESSTRTEIGGKPMTMPQIPESALAKMPPEQRAQVEAMMKSGRNGGPMVTKVCMTQESLRAGAFGRHDKPCTTKVVSSSATRQVLHVECAQQQAKSAGDITVEALDPQHIKGTVLMKSSVAGQTRDMKTTFESKWLSPDCGDVKPVLPK